MPMKGKISLSAARGPQGQGILKVEGSVDPTTFNRFEAAFQLFDKQDILYMVVDMALLTYISSSGLSLLIKAKTDRIQKDGDVVLVRPQTPILNIMKMLGLLDLFRIASSMEEALLPPAPRDGP
jgi:anti-anti-sigma factor